jgi:hypothetical protein
MSSRRTHRAPDPLRLGWVLVASGGAARAQNAPECPPSRLSPSERTEAGTWADALDALARELSFTDRPWSCAGATIAVQAQGRGPSTVEVVLPDGLLLRRHVAAAAELVPTVEGMLTVGRTPPPTPAALPAPPPAAPFDYDHERPPPVVVVAAPRPDASPGRVVFHFDGELVYRAAGAPLNSTPGLRAGAAIRVGRWGVTAGIQYETLSVAWSDDPLDFSVESWSAGLGVAWFAPLGRGLLGLGPTVAILSSSITASDLAGRSQDEIAQARVGLALSWRSRAEGLGLLLGARADVSGGSLFGSARDYNPTLPPPPTWGVQATAGVSYGARP